MTEGNSKCPTSRETDEICDTRTDACSFEPLRLRDCEGCHVSAIAPATNDEAVGMCDSQFDYFVNPF